MRLTPGLITDDEFKAMQAAKTHFSAGFSAKHHDPACNRTHPQVLFAFWQDDFQGGRIPYWHVTSEGQSKHSTLSMQGLREWGIL